jgi:hypothetical protein
MAEAERLLVEREDQLKEKEKELGGRSQELERMKDKISEAIQMVKTTQEGQLAANQKLQCLQ